MKNVEKLLLDSGFEKEKDDLWTKFENDYEYYVQIKENGFKQTLAYSPFNEETGDIDEDDSFEKEEFFSDLNLDWFSEQL